MKKLLFSFLVLGLIGFIMPQTVFGGSGKEKQNSQFQPNRINSADRVEEGLVQLPQTKDNVLAETQEEKRALDEAPMDLRANKKMRKEMRKKARKALWKNLFSPSKTNEVDFVIIVILAIFIPPLGVYLYEGSATTDFWISLILSILAWGGFGILGGLFGLLGLLAVIHALLVVFDVIDFG